ncbi:hypothetical protein QKD39_gp28 [Psittacine adenovirus 1]|uniref:Uncharacterized protein n=1 Tax=Psittacine adenovirus 1 TaxID=318592 RepID=A0A2Z5E1C5_9ADEN|nr:hypothetical protein QKD39_gp28 [Psittacine adenovirus 1]AXB73032.1 hypothetical protein [Psittacine adenovirus 1]
MAVSCFFFFARFSCARAFLAIVLPLPLSLLFSKTVGAALSDYDADRGPGG